MTPLRTKMIKAMQVRGFSVRTHESYLSAVTGLAWYYRRAPDQLGIDEIRRYFEYLATERSLSGATCRLLLNGIRFLYLQVLGWSSFDVDIPIPKKAQRIPELLTRAEVGRILTACAHPKHHMMLTLCYGCGLRLGELVSLKARDIDAPPREDSAEVQGEPVPFNGYPCPFCRQGHLRIIAVLPPKRLTGG